MLKNILLATDGTKLSVKAERHAIAMASALGAKLVAVHATPPYRITAYADGTVIDVPQKTYDAAAKTRARHVLDALVRRAEKAGVVCTTTHALADAPWRAILDAASKSKADSIVMASHGRRGLSALLLGSETQKVVTHARVPVTVVR
jgi:nucleotide-binding universal stress UspA family protein